MTIKTAEVDSATKEYYKSLYSNYPEFAEALTKEVKKRIVAELKRSKTAAAGEVSDLKIEHIASCQVDDGFTYEGILTRGATRTAFVLDLDADGDVTASAFLPL